jgi:hypothetical protein
MTRDFLPPHNDAVGTKPKKIGRPRLSDEERQEAKRKLVAKQSSYWRQNKAALAAKRKAKLANMTEAEKEAERQRMRIARKKSVNRHKAKIVELLQTVEALSRVIESGLLHTGEAS